MPRSVNSYCLDGRVNVRVRIGRIGGKRWLVVRRKVAVTRGTDRGAGRSVVGFLLLECGPVKRLKLSVCSRSCE